MLRERIDEPRIIPTPEERERLIRKGALFGHDVDDLVSVVKPATYRKWLRKKAGNKPKRKGGRPETDADTIRLILQPHPLTATQIKKYLRETYPLGLNHVIAAFKFLEGHRLVEVAGYAHKRGLKIYRITDLGKTVLSQVCGEQEVYSPDELR